MSEAQRYCDVALPVPVDRLFTYELPLPLRQRAQMGCRVLVPFGTRKLTGVILHLRGDAPDQDIRQVMAVLDDQPVLDRELLVLGNWIAEYYCAPDGEVFKGMLPLGGEVRRSTRYSLTEGGRNIARQLIIRTGADASTQVLGILEQQARSAEYLSSKVPNAAPALRALMKRGWVVAEKFEEMVFLGLMT